MSIEYRPGGDIFASEADALVNTVNCVGVMGKGLAKAFKERFPGNARVYEAACEDGRIQPGTPYVTRAHGPGRLPYIVHAPTKDHWRDPSRLSWIDEICAGLRWFVVEQNVRSIAIPKLGCGNGGLRWEAVRAIIERWLGDLDGVKVVVYGEA